MARGLFVLRSEILVPQVIVRLAYETHQSVSTPDRCDETSYLHSILSTVTIDRRVVKKGPKQRFASEVNPIENYTTPLNQTPGDPGYLFETGLLAQSRRF